MIYRVDPTPSGSYTWTVYLPSGRKLSGQAPTHWQATCAAHAAAEANR